MTGDETAAAAGPAAGTGAPALYPCAVSHQRRSPTRYALRHRTYLWLVDLDDLPVLPRALRPLAGFRARDHFTGRAPTLRAALDGFLTEHGVDPAGCRVLMLANARFLGYVFNPLSLYWCHAPDGTLRCVVAEVHNTYGERHAYLLRPGEDGEVSDGAEGEFAVDKEFYVSPFHPVDGRYRMRLPLPGDRLHLSIRLDRPDGGAPFTATVHGSRRPATPAALLGLAARHIWPTLMVSAAIRFHGIRLFLRGLPVRPRPGHRTTESAT
ncbi:DUF1365 domain-containing protein [Streptomyces sp. J2-1]|uniref:DUF1365 domain-containing protein n=1 Tax=Streptomyces corallincola TaxID=2851888 RepID=UPI001C39005D|nr:DUF1365 domain-containing protein [Streptomyces corallincola]MBV2354893.1 DUF1365 domain-containing protein [Streptomyces corallincola]